MIFLNKYIFSSSCILEQQYWTFILYYIKICYSILDFESILSWYMLL